MKNSISETHCCKPVATVIYILLHALKKSPRDFFPPGLRFFPSARSRQSVKNNYFNCFPTVICKRESFFSGAHANASRRVFSCAQKIKGLAWYFAYGRDGYAMTSPCLLSLGEKNTHAHAPGLLCGPWVFFLSAAYAKQAHARKRGKGGNARRSKKRARQHRLLGTSLIAHMRLTRPKRRICAEECWRAKQTETLLVALYSFPRRITWLYLMWNLDFRLP